MREKNNPDLPTYPPLFFVRITQSIRQFFLKLNRRFTHPNVVLWEMAQNMWLSAGISVAAELGIADYLKLGPRSIEQLAGQTDTHPDSLYRVMRMLASHGIFREKKGKIFETTALAVPLQDDQIRYLMLVHLNRNQFQIFGSLLESVRTGKTVSGAHSANSLFEQIGGDEKKNEWFNKAMSSASRMQVPALLPAYPFKKYRKIIDVGGGEGFLLASLLSRTVKSKGVLFDLPAVLKGKEGLMDKYALDGRLELKQGDFFKAVPGGGDLYILKSILHDWDDEESVQILRNIHRQMNQKARLLIIEAVLDERNNPSFGKMTDILMMAAAGGRERTRQEWEKLLASAKFRIRKIYPSISPHSIIEVVKI